MEKGLESWLHHQQLDPQFPNAKSSNLLFDDIGMRNSHFRCSIPCTIAVPTNGVFPMFTSSGLPNIKPSQSKEPHGWFYCLPRARQSLIRDMGLHDKFVPKTNLPTVVPTPGNGISGEGYAPVPDTGRPAKQFLVFDRTGNKTTMMFSSSIGTSIPQPSDWSRKQACFYDIKEGDIGNGSDGCYSGPNLTDELDNDHASVEGSEMREDSDEIAALLYSDEEDDCGDDSEEVSTGHSPSTMRSMTAYEKQDWFNEEGTDEVDSSAGPIKRQKLSEIDHRVPSITYTKTQTKLNRSSVYEEDAESSCAGCKPMQYTDMGSLPGSKRMRREIRETVSILQTILPDGKGNAVMVLEEAINYLKTLKFKAKSFGHSECFE